MNKLIQWMIASTWFKKSTSAVGGFCAGMWISRVYWQQINATLAIWGVEAETFTEILFGVAAAAGLSLSVMLSIAKKRLEGPAP